MKDPIRTLNNIKLIGTAHFSPESADQVKRLISEWKPEFVMLELDTTRFMKLTADDKEEVVEEKQEETSETPNFLQILQNFQEALGKELHLQAGIEMIAAAQAAKEHGAKILLIDQPIQKTFELLLNIPEEEKEDFATIQQTEEDSGSLHEAFEEIMNTLQEPDGYSKLVAELKSAYPNLYEILVESRDEYMLTQILEHLKKYPNSRVLIVVGYGHLESIHKELETKITS